MGGTFFDISSTAEAPQREATFAKPPEGPPKTAPEIRVYGLGEGVRPEAAGLRLGPESRRSLVDMAGPPGGAALLAGAMPERNQIRRFTVSRGTLR